jgi:Xaa-Pro dipeptidase
MATKQKKIFSALKDEVDAVVLMNGTEPNIDQSFFYATGMMNGLFEGCAAIVWPNKVEVLTSSLEELSARQAGVRAVVFTTAKEEMELLKKRLKGLKSVGINSDELTHSNYRLIRKCSKGARLVNVSKAVHKARMVKDADEITRISRACDIASKTADKIPDFVRAGVLETEAAADVNYRMMRLGASGPSFETNASFGPATAEPHYVPGAKKLKKGQLALFDFGAVYQRYVSDITRTYACSAPNKKQKRMYEVVLEAQLAAIDAVHGGASGKIVDKAARDVIDKSEFKGKFIHGTGHGLGVSVHDPGSISRLRKQVLMENMVMTIEPGVYVKGFGGVRIEDDVLITKNGCKVLTSASKEFISL